MADELGGRFGVRVEVSSTPATALIGRADLALSEREEIVMIAREAIVNAITHGHAQRTRRVWTQARNMPRVSDDGGGDRPPARPKEGSGCRRCGLVPSHWEHDSSIGRRAGGGTELEVRVTHAARGARSGATPASR